MIKFKNSGVAGPDFSMLEVHNNMEYLHGEMTSKGVRVQIKSDAGTSRTVVLNDKSARYLAKEILRLFPGDPEEQGYTGSL